MDSLFFFSFLFFFFLTMAPQVLEKKIALLFTYRKIVIIFQVSWTWTHSVKFPATKSWSATVQSQKKKKGSARRIYSCFFTHNGITTPKTTREGQESPTKTSLHLAWPPKFKNQVLFTPRAQSRFLDLGLLPRGCRPKSRSLPGRVEVIQPVVRACTTFWLTSTRITLTRVHRQDVASHKSELMDRCFLGLGYLNGKAKLATSLSYGIDGHFGRARLDGFSKVNGWRLLKGCSWKRSSPWRSRYEHRHFLPKSVSMSSLNGHVTFCCTKKNCHLGRSITYRYH